jgi:hypothetical protein
MKDGLMKPNEVGHWMGHYRNKPYVATVVKSKGIPWPRNTLIADICGMTIPVDDPDWKWIGKCIWFDRDKIKESIAKFEREVIRTDLAGGYTLEEFKPLALQAVGLSGHDAADRVFAKAYDNDFGTHNKTVWGFLKEYANLITGVDSDQ